jgi:hypothetical protein
MSNLKQRLTDEEWEELELAIKYKEKDREKKKAVSKGREWHDDYKDYEKGFGKGLKRYE